MINMYVADTTMIAKRAKAKRGMMFELKTLPIRAATLVIEVAMIADDAFLSVKATRLSRSVLMYGIYLAVAQVSLNKKVLSAPIPRTMSIARMCSRHKKGTWQTIL